MTRIAIVGSCITRDLWPIRGGGAERLHYVSRTSFATLLSEPVADFIPLPEPPGDLHIHEHNALCADVLSTALQRLIAWRPTHVIFDFIDERFDLLTLGRAAALQSGEMARSGYLAYPPFNTLRPLPRISAATERLWLEAAAEFAAVVRATPLSDAELILHSARWATHQRSPNGAITPLKDVEILGGGPTVRIEDYNALLVRQEAAFESLMPPMKRLEAEAFRVADATHRWGLSPFHYIPEYYDEIRSQILALGLDEAFTGLPVEPSAPEA